MAQKMNRRDFFRRAGKAGGALFIGTFGGLDYFIEPAAASPSPGGLHVIIDAGHGGNDPGASHGELQESDFTHDAAEALEARLAREKGITPWKIVTREHVVLHATQKGVRHSAPKKRAMRDAGYNVWARVQAVNGLARHLRKQGVNDSQMVLLSIHADSRRAHQPTSRHGGLVAYTSQSARSDNLARYLVNACNTLPEPVYVHDENPVRDFEWRYNKAGKLVKMRFSMTYDTIPPAVLLEAADINDPKTNWALRDEGYQKRFLDGVVAGLKSYFRHPDVKPALLPGAPRVKNEPRVPARKEKKRQPLPQKQDLPRASKTAKPEDDALYRSIFENAPKAPREVGSALHRLLARPVKKEAPPSKPGALPDSFIRRRNVSGKPPLWSDQKPKKRQYWSKKR